MFVGAIVSGTHGTQVTRQLTRLAARQVTRQVTRFRVLLRSLGFSWVLLISLGFSWVLFGYVAFSLVPTTGYERLRHRHVRRKQ